MKRWELAFTRQAQKDARQIGAAGLRPEAERLLSVLTIDPFQNPPPFQKLVGDLKGACSRRINIQHRLVYRVLEQEHIVEVLRMWTHCE